MIDHRQRRKARFAAIFAILAIFLVALALRLFRLAENPLRGDEAFAIEYWAAPWPDALALAGQEPHPLGTFALFALWKSIFGDGEWVMRLLPVLLSLPGVAATYALGKYLFKKQSVALLAGLLYAVHPFLIWHAQDVRNYAIWAAFSPVASWFFLIALDRNRQRDWIRYTLAATASAYIFFLEPLVIAAQGVYLLTAKRTRWRPWLVSLLVMSLLLIPWATQLVALAGSGYGGTAGGFDAEELLTWFLPVLTVGDTLPPEFLGTFWLMLLPGCLVTLIALWIQKRKVAQFLLASLVVPVIILSLASSAVDVFRPRYVVVVIPYLVLLIVGFVCMTTRSFRWRLVGIGIILGWVFINGWALANHYFDPDYRKSPNWRTLGAALTTYTQPGDLVVQQAVDPAFTYYFRGPADETSLPLSANAPAEETIAILHEAIDQRRAVWLIPAELPGFDDERVPLTWLSNETQLTAELNIDGFQLLEFRAWDPRPEEYRPSITVDFDGIITLIDFQAEILEPDLLRVTLYWQPKSQTERPLTGFAHLVSIPNPETGSPLWTQDDHVVPGGATDTTNWAINTVHRDVYLLPWPDNLSAMSWVVHLGLYDPETLDRLPVDGSDHFEIPGDAFQEISFSNME